MQSRTVRQSVQLPVQCPCGAVHAYDFQAILEEKIDVTFDWKPDKSETVGCAVVCPVRGTTFMVDVPVKLQSGQRVVDINGSHAG